MKDLFSLKGKVALVTGASSGLGVQFAKALARQGADVAICARRVEKLEQVKKEVEALGVKCYAHKCDVLNTEEIRETVKAVESYFGKIDILVNNAGVTADNLLMRMSEAEWDRVLSINLKGCFNMIKHVTPYMLRKRYGRIVSISSVVGLMGNAGQANYAASKAGIVGLTKSVAKELGSRNITANAVAPGFIKTAMTDALTEEQKQAMYKLIPLGCLGEVQDIANAVKFLVSEDARYITGVALKVDGGMYI